MAEHQDQKKLLKEFDQAVNILRMTEYSSFLSGIHIMWNNDKQFLIYHGGSVSLKILHILLENGLNWEMKTLEENLEKLLLTTFSVPKN